MFMNPGITLAGFPLRFPEIHHSAQLPAAEAPQLRQLLQALAVAAGCGMSFAEARLGLGSGVSDHLVAPSHPVPELFSLQTSRHIPWTLLGFVLGRRSL